MTSRLCAAVNVQLARAAMNRFGSPIVSNSSWGTSIVDTFFQAMLGRATHVHGLDKYTFWGLWDASKRDKAKAWRSFQPFSETCEDYRWIQQGFNLFQCFFEDAHFYAPMFSPTPTRILRKRVSSYFSWRWEQNSNWTRLHDPKITASVFLQRYLLPRSCQLW